MVGIDGQRIYRLRHDLEQSKCVAIYVLHSALVPQIPDRVGRYQIMCLATIPLTHAATRLSYGAFVVHNFRGEPTPWCNLLQGFIILATPDQGSQEVEGYLTVGQAAALLGVTAATLRNWDRAGKLKARRHPINGYRLYAKSDIERLLTEIRGGGHDC
jgi:excisionase family DNA binding protein